MMRSSRRAAPSKRISPSLGGTVRESIAWVSGGEQRHSEVDQGDGITDEQAVCDALQRERHLLPPTGLRG